MDNHPENWVSNLDVSINGGNKIGKIHAPTNWTSFNFTKKKLFSKLMLQIFRIFARVITHPSSMWFHEIFITKIINTATYINYNIDFEAKLLWNCAILWQYLIATTKISWNQNLKTVCFFSIAWLQHDQFNIESALEKTIGTMQCVLNRTLNYAKTVGGEHPSPQQLELKLIQSRDDLLNPQVKIKATKI